MGLLTLLQREGPSLRPQSARFGGTLSPNRVIVEELPPIVLFKDISVTGKTMLPSAFTGLDAAHDVRGVTIENLRFNGRPVTSAPDARLEIRKYVQDVRFVESRDKQ